MAQDGTTAGGSSYTIDNVTFPVGRSKLQSIFDAIRTTNIGNTAPDLVAGQFWIDNNTPSTTVWTLYFYDGTDNISFATIDTVNNTVNFIDSTFDLINDTTPQLGGDLSSNGNNINFGDNDKAVFGAGSDLQIYHNGSASYIKEAGTGNLSIGGDNEVYITNSADNEFKARFITNGAVELYYDNSKKFETTSAGATVTGNLTATGNLTSTGIDDNATSTAITIDSSQNVDVAGLLTSDGLTMNTGANSTYTLEFGANRTSDSQALGIIRGSWDGTVVSQINLSAGDDTTNKDNGQIFFRTAEAGSTANRLQIAENGDISFYEDTGTTAKLFWDASAERLGIGTSSPIEKMTVNGAIVSTSSNSTSFTTGANRSILDFSSGGTRLGHFRGATASGSGYVSVFVDSSVKMHIDSSGNVGIGTSSPSSNLHVSGANTGLLVDFQNPAGNHGLRVRSGNNEFNDGSELVLDVRSGTNNNPLLNVHAGGNVGIGLTNPVGGLDVTKSNANLMNLHNPTNTSGSQARMYLGAKSNPPYQRGVALVGSLNSDFSHNMQFWVSSTSGAGPTEKMRIDSVGRLMVGKTAVNTGVAGCEMRGDGLGAFTKTNSNALLVSRLSSDGEMIQFRKDGVVLGSIGTASSKLHIASTGNSGIRFRNDLNCITPCNSDGTNSDADQDLGEQGVRFRRLYLSEGIRLGGTGSANNLDDYEEGTWTPSYSFATSGSVTESIQYGHYTKIGNRVFAQFQVATSSISSPTGQVTIEGLPFAVANTTGVKGSGAIHVAYRFNSSTSSYVFRLFLAANSSNITIYTNTPEDTSGSSLQGSDFTGGGNYNNLQATVFYQTA
jgi:hypothetical protein